LGLLVLSAKFFAYPSAEFFAPITAVYFGLEISWLGAVIAAVWGFVDAFCGGTILAWLYNRFSK